MTVKTNLSEGINGQLWLAYATREALVCKSARQPHRQPTSKTRQLWLWRASWLCKGLFGGVDEGRCLRVVMRILKDAVKVATIYTIDRRSVSEGLEISKT